MKSTLLKQNLAIIFVLSMIFFNAIQVSAQLNTSITFHFYDKDGNEIQTPDWFYGDENESLTEEPSLVVEPKNNPEVNSSINVNFYDKDGNEIQTPTWLLNSQDNSLNEESNNPTKTKQLKSLNLQVADQKSDVPLSETPIIVLNNAQDKNPISRVIEFIISLF